MPPYADRAGFRLEKARLPAHILRMREQWIEKLVCPSCGNTGSAELSQTDGFSWDVRVDVVPAGFIQEEHGIKFYCATCFIPVEP